MKALTYAVAAVAAAGFVVGGSFAAAQGSRDEPTVGSTVTLTTCVERSPTNNDKFLLTHLTDNPAHPQTKGGRVMYWISKVDQLRPHVGHQIRLTGKITDVDKEEMEMKVGEAPDGGMIVQIEGPGQHVKGTPAQTGVSAAQAAHSKDITTTLVKLKVDKLEMVTASCPSITR